MNLHEYQSKFRFAEFGIPILKGKTASTPQEAYEAARELGCPVVVKAQVLVGGRGKAGGVKVARTPEQAEDHANAILGMKIKGLTVRKVLIDPAANIAQEIYLGITNDRAAGRPVIMASSEGGIEIEQVARENPDAIAREHIDPFLGLLDYQARNLASGINLPHEHWRVFSRIAANLYRCYLASDAVLAEINPLVITGENQLIALDGKMIIDDNALFRQPQLAEMRDTDAEPKEETLARAAGISYVKLNGQIGCMVNGAGLAMTTMDMTKLYGGDEIGPANFLDIGGGAQASKVAAALRIILDDANVKSVLFNIFGGITRCDEVARGILEALNEVPSSLPMVIRLVGTNSEEGRAIIDNANIPNLSSAATLTEAAKKAVEAARKALAADKGAQ
ncbi:MAG: ADP-forming succinate--CoA ligase subunit beta [Chloroflexi bacterium]|nr:ADP-forming succinate--CoA ligase subunit beta [Chloroflexota bacterium]MDL1885152.1 ADP-forming succinate--CoA ligase subunit beta [Anaerolineae bacterium CFX8]